MINIKCVDIWINKCFVVFISCWWYTHRCYIGINCVERELVLFAATLIRFTINFTAKRKNGKKKYLKKHLVKRKMFANVVIVVTSIGNIIWLAYDAITPQNNDRTWFFFISFNLPSWNGTAYAVRLRQSISQIIVQIVRNEIWINSKKNSGKFLAFRIVRLSPME